MGVLPERPLVIRSAGSAHTEEVTQLVGGGCGNAFPSRVVREVLQDMEFVPVPGASELKQKAVAVQLIFAICHSVQVVVTVLSQSPQDIAAVIPAGEVVENLEFDARICRA